MKPRYKTKRPLKKKALLRRIIRKANKREAKKEFIEGKTMTDFYIRDEARTDRIRNDYEHGTD